MTAPNSELDKLLEHGRYRMTTSYTHFANAYLVEAGERVGNTITAAMANQMYR